MHNNLVLPQQSISVAKMAGAVIMAFAVTFGLFVMMQKLIANNDLPIENPLPPVVVDIFPHITDSELVVKPTLKPKPEIKPTPKPETKFIDETPDNTSLISKFVPLVNMDPISLATNTKMTSDEGMARPIVRMEPKYPAEAARDGIEGWVKLLFSIDVLGQVQNIEVIESEPKRIFDREATRALSKWKYKAQIVAGVPQAQDGMMVVLDFKLTQ